MSGGISLLGDQDWVLSCLVLKLGCLQPVWVPVTSLGACDQSVCLEEYQLPVELDTKDLPQFLLLLLGSAPGESWVVWVDSARHCMSPCLQCPPAHPSTHLHAPCAPLFPGFFLHPLHFLCPGTLPSLSHGPWVGKFFLLGKTLAVIPRGLQGLSPKGGIGVLGSAYIQIHYSVSSTTNTGPSLQCYPTPVVITSV